MDSPADHAIAGARGVRRRRVVTAVCVIVVALAIGGFAKLREVMPPVVPVPPATQPANPTSPPSTSTGTRPDVLTDRSATFDGWGRIVTGEGRTIPLAGIDGAVDTAYQTADGWLVLASQQANGITLWLMRSDGSAYRLIDKSEGVAVGPDGRRFAWRDSGRIYVGHLANTTVTVDKSTPAPDRGEPIAFTGTAVILGYSETGGGIDHHDVWLPSKGDYVPAWTKTTSVISVYQPAHDGSLFGVVQASAGSKVPCLAKLDPAVNLNAIRTACGLPLTIDPVGLVSPNGRWLEAPLLDNGQVRVGLIDLSAVFDSPTVTARWDATSPATWLDSTTSVLNRGDGTPMTARIGLPDLNPLTGLSAPFEVVRRLA
jgi:hypothetical protein